MELKRGPSVVKELRSAQRLWHRTSLKLGIQTFGASIDLSGGQVSVFRITLDGRVLGEELLATVSAAELYHNVITEIIISARCFSPCVPFKSEAY